MKRIKTWKVFESHLELTQAQKKFLDKSTKGTWSVNSDNGFIDVDGNFNVVNSKEIIGTKGFNDIQFGQVSGNFLCKGNQLTSLKGAPSHVGGDFWCIDSQLTSLEGAPSHVGGDFWCFSNKLTSLKGAPSHVGGDFLCYLNQLISLEGLPSGIKDFHGDRNPVSEKVLNAIFEFIKLGADNKTATIKIIAEKNIALEDLILLIKGIGEYHLVADAIRKNPNSLGIINKLDKKHPELFAKLFPKRSEDLNIASDLGGYGF